MEQNSVDLMYSQIISEAQKEADSIIQKATNSASERLTLAEQQARTQAARIQKKADEECALLRKKGQSTLLVEKQKILLQKEGELSEEVLSEIKQELLKFAKTKAYETFLKNSLFEAVCAIDTEKVIVAIGENDTISSSLFKNAEKELADKYRKKVSLSLSPDRHHFSGIIVSDSNNRVRINNTLQERVNMQLEEIQQLINNRLFKGEKILGR